MLQLYNVNHNKIYGLVNYKDIVLEREINQLDTLSFLYPISDSKHDSIQEECYIRTQDNEYVIKEVNYNDENYDEYVCKVNIEDISGKDVSHFEAIEQTCTDSVNLALAGTGWAMGSCDVTKKRTAKKNNCTAFDVMQEIQSAFNCEMTFDAVNKKVYIYEEIGADKGAYFIDQLNLKKVDQQRNTYDYITRLIPIGKDGLNIASVNNGKNYVENYQYSNKIITAYWEDNRYTVAQDLKEDAIERLKYLSKPLKAYSADVYDLAKISEDKYSILDYSLGDTITLISKDRNIKEKQRIVKSTEYPEEPEKNTIEIANKLASVDNLIVRFQDTSDTVDTVTTTDGSLDGSKIDGVDWTKVKNISIGTTDIQDAAIITAKIGDLQVTNEKVESISANKLTAGTIDAGIIKVKNLDAGNIDANSVTTENASALLANIAKAIIGTSITIDQQSDMSTIQLLRAEDAQINTAKINNLTVVNSNGDETPFLSNGLLADNVVPGSAIVDGAIETQHLNLQTHMLM